MVELDRTANRLGAMRLTIAPTISAGFSRQSATGTMIWSHRHDKDTRGASKARVWALVPNWNGAGSVENGIVFTNMSGI
ncbi:MAG: hypothetical protein HON62_00345 [Rhodospirillaceae bacterium]|jgi:hypothetical protein|nr:hypothetical protein [Rhodospirillaceae bacterium]